MDAPIYIRTRMDNVMSATENGGQNSQSIRRKRPKGKRKEVEFLHINEGTMQDGISLPRHISKNILFVQFVDNQQKFATTKIFQPM